jgi:hypothetical protein
VAVINTLGLVKLLPGRRDDMLEVAVS